MANENHEAPLSRDTTPSGLKATQPVFSSHDRGAGVLESRLSLSSETSTPCSPPPTYASAVQSSVQVQNCKLSDTRSFGANILDQNDNRLSTQIETPLSSPAQSESKGIWAYQLPMLSHNDPSVPELSGDTVYLSATNTHGPINPFEYNVAPQSSSFSSPSKRMETKDVAELLGDFTFAVELPCNDPGPPPGYPPRSRRSTAYQSPYNTSASSARGYEKTKPVPELPGISLRRPVLSHAFSEPVNMNHELPTRQFAPSEDSPLPQRTSVMGTYQRGVTASKQRHFSEQTSELPGSSASEYSWTSVQSSPSPSLVSAGLATELPSNTGASHHRRVLSQDSRRWSGPSASSVSSRSVGPAESVSLTRMRRQKQMMDLLGSIGS